MNLEELGMLRRIEVMLLLVLRVGQLHCNLHLDEVNKSRSKVIRLVSGLVLEWGLALHRQA